MEIKPPEYYRMRRREKKLQRKKHAIKKSTKYALILICIILFSLIMVSSVSEINAGKRRAAEKKKKQSPILIAYNGHAEVILPISLNDATGIGYHEAFNPYAVSFAPIGKQVNSKKMSKKRAHKILRDFNHLSYIIMNRGGRNGRNYSAIDIGGKAGSLVRAPINGKVVKIRNYKLYGYIDDYEVHILPKGYKDRHLVIIHIDSLKIKTGDEIIKGETPIGIVRTLSDKFKPQLRQYTKDRGDHIHIQFNRIRKNGKCTLTK